MSGIPDDVLAAAKRAAYAVEGTHEEGWITSSNGVDVIARAILAERERCAKVAEEVGADDTLKDGATWSSTFDDGNERSAQAIARAIRTGAAHG